MRPKSPNSHRPLLVLGCVLTLLAFSPVLLLGQASSPKPRRNWSCLKRSDLWRDRKGRPRWLNSDELKDRTEASEPIERPGALGKNTMKGSVTIELVIDSDGKVVCARGVKGHPNSDSSRTQIDSSLVV